VWENKSLLKFDHYYNNALPGHSLTILREAVETVLISIWLE